MSAVRIETVDRTSGSTTSEQVYLALREAIVSAELRPGLKLSENELGGELGVSRTPVREALARLRDERLVAIVPQLGTFVTLISPRAVGDAAFVREALECAAISRAVSRVDMEAVEELRWNLTAQDQARESGNERTFDRLDEDLHRRLCEYSGHAIAWALSRRANGHLDRIRRLSLPDPSYLSEMLSEHRQIVDAVAEGDVPAAEDALRHHLRMVPSQLPRLQQQHPDYFE
ncbi:MAG TPA: GntR family transcriptional regulator [Solirubrobacteraceae bacterium]|jgi:DNA-binding GntR family transcriptional regulator|nr:GntR family transcriptional regulator [Solirubrobacteraceae bacterium]